MPPPPPPRNPSGSSELPWTRLREGSCLLAAQGRKGWPESPFPSPGKALPKVWAHAEFTSMVWFYQPPQQSESEEVLEPCRGERNVPLVHLYCLSVHPRPWCPAWLRGDTLSPCAQVGSRRHPEPSSLKPEGRCLTHSQRTGFSVTPAISTGLLLYPQARAAERLKRGSEELWIRIFLEMKLTFL